MTWQYRQSNGELTQYGIFQGTGYSGTGVGRNNPNVQDMPDVGPLPCGSYTIGPSYDDPHLGPCVMHLDPLPDTDTFGRSAFRIHGDNINHDASHGCVILGPAIRHLIANSNDDILNVVP